MLNEFVTVGGTTRSHDNNGNLTDDGTYKFGYDFENRLVELRNSTTNALIASYRYDALGRRVEKALNGGATTRYVLDGVQVVEEFDGSNVWQARYVYEDGIDQPRCMDRADIADVNGNANTTEVLRFHYHQQALGSVTELTQPTGAVVEWVTYDVYGLPTIRNQVGTTVTQSAVGNPWLYTGREYDQESGLYFYRARTYDPGTGRFLQRDPLGFADGLSLLVFAGSSPTRFRDPLGLNPASTGSSTASTSKVLSGGDFATTKGALEEAASDGMGELNPDTADASETEAETQAREEKEAEEAQGALEAAGADAAEKLLGKGEVDEWAVAGALGALGAGAVAMWGDDVFAGQWFRSPSLRIGGSCLGGGWQARMRGRWRPFPGDDEDAALGLEGDVEISWPIVIGDADVTISVLASGDISVDSDGDADAHGKLEVKLKIKF